MTITRGAITEESSGTSDKETHKKFAIDCFNLTWQLIDKKGRTKEEEDRMVNSAHASRFHWGEIGAPVNLERGDWQISRVYALLGRAEPALHHARRCLETCEANGIGDWDLAFAYEAMARAFSVSGQTTECEKHASLAREAGSRIKEEADQELFLSEMKSLRC